MTIYVVTAISGGAGASTTALTLAAMLDCPALDLSPYNGGMAWAAGINDGACDWPAVGTADVTLEELLGDGRMCSGGSPPARIIAIINAYGSDLVVESPHNVFDASQQLFVGRTRLCDVSKMQSLGAVSVLVRRQGGQVPLALAQAALPEASLFFCREDPAVAKASALGLPMPKSRRIARALTGWLESLDG